MTGASAGLRVHAAERLLPSLLRAWGGTWRFHVEGVDHLREARERSPDGRVIFCCWHGRFLPLVYLVRDRAMRIVVSRHRDGEIAARVAARLGFEPLRGSTSRGGERALREALRPSGAGDLALTPDGPRGPRGRFQAGAVYLASRAGLPVVPVGCGAKPAWRLRSWDAFLLPRPFSTVVAVCGPPLLVPADARPDELERHRAAGEEAVAAATAAADAAVGRTGGARAAAAGVGRVDVGA